MKVENTIKNHFDFLDQNDEKMNPKLKPVKWTRNNNDNLTLKS